MGGMAACLGFLYVCVAGAPGATWGLWTDTVSAPVCVVYLILGARLTHAQHVSRCVLQMRTTMR